MKDKLIDRLFYIVSECKVSELKADKINNDLAALSLKLLGKLGCLSRGRELPINMKAKNYDEREAKMTEL